MTYKFKVGDNVVMTGLVKLNPGGLLDIGFDKWVNIPAIITKRTKGQLGNQYEISNPKNDDSIAWCFEIQLEKIADDWNG